MINHDSEFKQVKECKCTSHNITIYHRIAVY